NRRGALAAGGGARSEATRRRRARRRPRRPPPTPATSRPRRVRPRSTRARPTAASPPPRPSRTRRDPSREARPNNGRMLAVAVALAFVAGLITAISPCVLPVLPIVLAGGASGGRRRPFAIVAGLATCFLVSLLFAVWVLDRLGLPRTCSGTSPSVSSSSSRPRS